MKTLFIYLILFYIYNTNASYINCLKTFSHYYTDNNKLINEVNNWLKDVKDNIYVVDIEISTFEGYFGTAERVWIYYKKNYPFFSSEDIKC